MGYYKTAKICLNGHMITDDLESSGNNDSFCSECGAKAITHCKYCNANIHGYYFVPGVLNLAAETTVPAYCHDCGEPYPWTETFLKTAEEMVDMFNELSTEQKQQLKETFPDLIVETPQSKLAALRAAKLINGLTSFGKDIFVKLLQDNVVDSLFALMHLKS